MRPLQLSALRAAVASAAFVMLGLPLTARADFLKPWDPLTTEAGTNKPSWIGTGINLYTVNGPTYQLGFDDAKPKNNYSASGMNALRFSYVGGNTGHRVGGLHDAFSIVNTQTNTFTDFVLVVAIDANSLPAGFHLSVTGPTWTAPGDPPGTNSNARDLSGDFLAYDPAGYATGRPSGYYADFTDNGSPFHGTNPTSEMFAYDFPDGFVTAFALRGLSVGQNQSVSVAYDFDNLPGKAVFSVYGKQSDLERVKHTNREILDLNGGTPVSTFEVTPVPEPGTRMLLLCGALVAASGRLRWGGRP